MRVLVLLSIAMLVSACGPSAGGGTVGGMVNQGRKADKKQQFDGDKNVDRKPDSKIPGGSGNGVKLECSEKGQQQDCYDAEATTVGVGECKIGQRTCNGEFWSACIGQILPVPEYCDNRDNDCDGEVDEGVKSACGDCNPYCTQVESGSDTEDPLTPAEDNSMNVVKTKEGWVTLTSTAVSLNVIWIANSQEGTVSKLDTNTGHEQGRYRICSNPSRTAVSAFGDGWVGCRSDKGLVARIVNFEGECIDKNGNGVIDTSRDDNGDHVIQPSEMKELGQDECVKWTSEAGKPSNANITRALGVHTDGFGWAGLWESKRLVKLDPNDGSLLQTIEIDAQPYGLVIDKAGVIWVSGRGGKKLVRVDPKTGIKNNLQPPGGINPYGIALDEFGRVWVADCCGNSRVWMFDPKNNNWQQVSVKARPRGLVANLNGRMFVANDQSHQVAVIDMNAMQTVSYVDLGAGRYPLGMALDSAGFVWAVNQSSSSVWKINSFNLNKVGEYPVGKGPYTYSDMTGSAFFDSVPPGWYRHRFEAAHVSGLTGLMALGNADWGDLHVDYVAPPGATIKFRVRTGKTQEEINSALWTPLVGPFPDQTFPVQLNTVIEKPGHFLDVEVWLYPSEEGHMPVLKGFDLKYEAMP